MVTVNGRLVQNPGSGVHGEGKAVLMNGQRSFWFKRPALGLHVKHTPPGHRGDNTVSDKINSVGLIRTNTDTGETGRHLTKTQGTKAISSSLIVIIIMK